MEEIPGVDRRPGVVAADGRERLLVPLPRHRLAGDGAVAAVRGGDPVGELVAGLADVIGGVERVARAAVCLLAHAGEELGGRGGRALTRGGGGERDAGTSPAHEGLCGVPGPRQTARVDPHAGLERQRRHRAVPELELLAAVVLGHLDQGHQRQPLRDRDLASRDGAVARRRPEDVGELRAEDGVQPERGCEAVVHLLGVLGAEGRRRLALPTGERDRPLLRARDGAAPVGRQALIDGLLRRESAVTGVAHASRRGRRAGSGDPRPGRIEGEHARDLLLRGPVGRRRGGDQNAHRNQRPRGPTARSHR